MAYSNPFRKVSNLTAARVDQGVDFTGSGKVKALGTGRIVIADASNSGWPGGGFIEERLATGPAKGHYNYVAETITPTVRPGQLVFPWTTIGVMSEGGVGIETGWAAPNQDQTLAYVTGQANYQPGGDPGAHPTAYGAAYSQMLQNLGAPAGTMSEPPVGTVAPWAQKAAGQPAEPTAQTTSFVGNVFSSLLGLLGVPNIKELAQRFGLILLGGVIVIVGIVMIAHTNKETLEQVITGKPPEKKEPESSSPGEKEETPEERRAFEDFQERKFDKMTKAERERFERDEDRQADLEEVPF